MSVARVTLPRAPSRATALPTKPPRVSRRPRESLIFFVVAAAGYLAVATWMVRHKIIYGDALSRVANAYYVIYSRYPHLPAVGFVWNPLPSLVLLPLLPAKALFPVLVQSGFAGNVASALFMAGSVVLVASCLRKLKVSLWWRTVLTAIYGCQPIILLYGGSGMSEPMLLFFCLLTTSLLIGWVQHRQPGSLVAIGLALGLAYMTRYESIGPACATMFLVAVVSAATAPGSSVDRLRRAVNDLVLVAGPFVFAFAMWAVSARILVGEWFPTFSSDYGNSAQVSTAKAWIETFTGSSLSQIALYAGHQLTTLEPLVVPIAVLAVVVILSRRRLLDLVAPLVLGGVLAFDNAAFIDGKSFGWLRFQIAVVPLAVLLVGSLIAAIEARHQRVGRRGVTFVACVLGATMLTVAIPTQFHALANNTVHDEGAPMLRAVLHPDQASKEERLTLQNFASGKVIANYLDALHLKPGSVLTDSAYSYFVILASKDPHQFVITSDLDFKDSLADPARAHIAYLLVPANGRSDALEHRWPGLYMNGGGEGVLAKQFSGVVFGDWRLYRLKSSR